MSCFQMGFNYFYRVENPFPQLSDNGQVVQVGSRYMRKWQCTSLAAHLPITPSTLKERSLVKRSLSLFAFAEPVKVQKASINTSIKEQVSVSPQYTRKEKKVIY